MPISSLKKIFLPAMAIIALFFIFQAIRLSLYKNFSIDEFTYAHAGWLIAKGNLPYRDFFSHHLPLGYFVLSIPFRILDDNPCNIIYQRALMWPFLFIILFSASSINRFHNRNFSWLTGILLLSIPVFTIFAIEIRPDLMALASFALALSLCYTNPNNRGIQGVSIGILVAIAICFSEKVLVYGSVFLIGSLIDLSYNSRKNKEYMVGDPKSVALGFLCGICLYYIFLSTTNSLESWIKHSIQFTLDYQSIYNGFSWKLYLWPPLMEILYLIPFVLLGAFQSFFKWYNSGEMRWRNPDLLLLLGLFTTLFSYFFQKQPFPYSLMPFYLLLTIFAYRGIFSIPAILNRTGLWIRYISIIVILLTGLTYFSNTILIFNKRLKKHNTSQLESLKWINKNTFPTDYIYDNSGSFISRQHADFFYFTNDFMRQHWVEYLNTNIPQSIEKTGSTIFIKDSRYESLPGELKKYIKNHFVPLDNSFWIWGKMFRKIDFMNGAKPFHAIRTGRYFVSSLKVTQEGRFFVDGNIMHDHVFKLDRGFHDIEYSGMLDEFYLVWLPRKEKPFLPIKATKDTIVPIF